MKGSGSCRCFRMPRLFSGTKEIERRQDAEDGKIEVDGRPFAEYRKIHTTYAVQMDEPFLVETLEGMMAGQAGDYLAIGVYGEMYPIAKDVFDATYDPVDY